MGVPMLTLLGDRHAGRVSATFLHALDLDEFVANTEDEFIEIACRWAQDFGRLAELRAGLRERMAASPLCDGAGYMQRLETAYRTMWSQWCARSRKS